MELSINKHEATKIDEYTSKGYTASYQMEEGKLKDLNTGKLFDKHAVTIIEEFRYEGMSNPSDCSILYVLHTDDGKKGTLLLPYGPYADGELSWFMKEVEQDMSRRSEEKLNKQINS